jgi:hypothetical protein
METELFLSRLAYRAGTPVVGSVRIHTNQPSIRSQLTSACPYLTARAHLCTSSSWRSNSHPQPCPPEATPTKFNTCSKTYRCASTEDVTMMMLKRQLRKNYSVDDKTKNQSSKAKNGRESKKSSKASEPKKTAASNNTKKDNQGKSEKQKKRKKDKADEPNQKPPKATRKKESQGGSNKGGKGGGAAKR